MSWTFIHSLSLVLSVLVIESKSLSQRLVRSQALMQFPFKVPFYQLDMLTGLRSVKNELDVSKSKASAIPKEIFFLCVSIREPKISL